MLFLTPLTSFLFTYLGLSSDNPYDGPGKTARIAIIGGGPAGVSFLKGLTDVPVRYRKDRTVDLFDSREAIGGIW